MRLEEVGDPLRTAVRAPKPGLFALVRVDHGIDKVELRVAAGREGALDVAYEVLPARGKVCEVAKSLRHVVNLRAQHRAGVAILVVLVLLLDAPHC